MGKLDSYNYIRMCIPEVRRVVGKVDSYNYIRKCMSEVRRVVGTVDPIIIFASVYLRYEG